MMKLNARLWACLLLSLTVISLSGCASNKYIINQCEPIYTHEDDVLTLGTKQQIATNNKSWEKNNE